MLTWLFTCNRGPVGQMRTVSVINALHVVANVAERCNCASCHAECVQPFHGPVVLIVTERDEDSKLHANCKSKDNSW